MRFLLESKLYEFFQRNKISFPNKAGSLSAYWFFQQVLDFELKKGNLYDFTRASRYNFYKIICWIGKAFY